MGYRSDGAFRIVGEYNEMLTQLATLRFTAKDGALMNEMLALCVLNEHAHVQDQRQVILGFDMDDWKWYSGYPEVDMLNSIFEHFSALDEKLGFSGAFVRIGEDDNDVETQYFGEDPYDLVAIIRNYDAIEIDSSKDLRSTLESSADKPQGLKNDQVVEPQQAG